MSHTPVTLSTVPALAWINFGGRAHLAPHAGRGGFRRRRWRWRVACARLEQAPKAITAPEVRGWSSTAVKPERRIIGDSRV